MFGHGCCSNMIHGGFRRYISEINLPLYLSCFQKNQGIFQICISEYTKDAYGDASLNHNLVKKNMMNLKIAHFGCNLGAFKKTEGHFQIFKVWHAHVNVKRIFPFYYMKEYQIICYKKEYDTI